MTNDEPEITMMRKTKVGLHGDEQFETMNFKVVK